GDEELIAVDTGPAVVNRKAARLSGRNEAERNAVVIDRYFEMKSQAVAWGKSHPHFMKVRVLSPRPALAIAEKGEPKHRNLPSQAIVATQRISRPPGSARLFQLAIFISVLSSPHPAQLPATPVGAPVASLSPETLSKGAAAGHSIDSVCYK